MMRSAKNNGFQVVNFISHDFCGSVDIDHVSKVIAMPRLSLTPEGPDYVVGLINIAGNVIPVIDLSMRLKIGKPEKYTINTPIIICKTDSNKSFGVVVDKVGEITSVDWEMIQDDIGKFNKKLINGAIKYPETISLIVNVDALLEDIN